LIYLDTSVVAPFYWAEALSNQVEELLSHQTEPTVSALAIAGIQFTVQNPALSVKSLPVLLFGLVCCNGKNRSQ